MGRKASGLAVMAAVAVMLCLVFTGQAFAGPTDNVLSENIKEADGTSGQDTNSGSGVKTGHIQDGAITTPKIVNGAVTDDKISGTISGSKLGSHTHNGADIVNGTVSTSKMADGAVTMSKIADGAVTDAKIADDAVTTPKIVNGAVTDAKITGPISGSKLGAHTHSGADVTSGTIGVDKLATYAGVRVVHKGPADGVNTFNTVNAALSSITNSSASNRYIIKVMPGEYDERDMWLIGYVDIVGSGQENTVLISDIDWREPDITLENLRVEGYIFSTGTGIIRDVTVEMSTGSMGIRALNADLEIYDSKVLLFDGTESAIGISGVSGATNLFISGTTIDMISNTPAAHLCGASFVGTMVNSIIKVKSIDGSSGICGARNSSISNSRVLVETDTDLSGSYGIAGSGLEGEYFIVQNSDISTAVATPTGYTAGVYAAWDVATIENSTVISSHTAVKMYSASSAAVIDNSKIIGAVAGINKASGSFRIGASQISGGHNGTSGVDKVVNCHDGSYNPIPDL